MNEEKIEKKPISNIIPNRQICRDFTKDDIIVMAESIKENGQIQPIIVRRFGKKLEICKGHLRFKAIQYLNRDIILVVIRDYTEIKGMEIALVANFHRKSFSSIDKEKFVWKLMDSGQYKNKRALGKVLGISEQHIGRLIWCYEARKKTNGTLVSTETLIATKNGFTDDERQQFCDLFKHNKLNSRDGRDAAKLIRTCSEGLKKAILNGEVTYEKVKDILDKRKPALKNHQRKIEREYNKKETIKKIIKKESYHSPDIVRFLVDFLRELEPSFIEDIKDEIEKKQALSDAVFLTGLAIRLLHKLSIIDSSSYESILKILNMEPSYVEMLKEDGHNYSLPTEWKTPFEEVMDEKNRLLKTSKKEPLEAI